MNINSTFHKTNIVKKAYTYEDLQPLSVKDRKKLAKVILGYGNLRKVMIAASCTDVTIKSAIDGRRLKPHVRKRFEDFLSDYK